MARKAVCEVRLIEVKSFIVLEVLKDCVPVMVRCTGCLKRTFQVEVV